MSASDYHHDEAASFSLAYLMPAVMKCLPPPPASVFEIGCGNGAAAKSLLDAGYDVSGIDPSKEGIAYASRWGRFETRSIYDDLSCYGTFDAVLSLEVVEHLTEPRVFARQIRDLLKPHGVAIVSTPYHGYLKNLSLALLNKWDSHLDPLWDNGHIKLWSPETLSFLFSELGMRRQQCLRVGRIPPLAKSMVLTFIQ